MLRNLLPVTCVLLAAAGLASPKDGASVTWKGKSYALSRLPDEMSTAARSTAEAWSAWTAETGHVMHLDDSAQVLLIGPDDRSRIRRSMRLIDETVELLDELLPSPMIAPTAPVEVTPNAARDGDVLPEDPEGVLPEDPEETPTDAEVSRVAGSAQGTANYTWGAGDLQPNTQVAVMCVLEDAEEYNRVLDFLARQQPYLVQWKSEAKGQVGFAIEMPLCGAYVLKADGMEEWSPENELVHRVARLLVMRRFGQVPYWASVGLSWHAELAIRRGIYCFPYRDEFVSVTEHNDWNRVLRSMFSKRDDQPVAMAEFASWQPGSYQDVPAKLSWGTVDYLARAHPAAMPAIFEDLRLYWDRENRRTHADGTWERIPGYTIPPDTQLEYIEKHTGPGFLAALSEWWRTGKLPKRRD